jgi:hypothetical protein
MLLQTPGVTFFSLQAEIPGRDEATLAAFANLIDLGPRLISFGDTAAVVRQVDLVITVDTALAHLAGALATPTWTLIPYCPDWRWMMGRTDTPWYPTMRLFRQPEPANWAAVIGLAAAELAKHGEQSRARNPVGWAPGRVVGCLHESRKYNASARPSGAAGIACDAG